MLGIWTNIATMVAETQRVAWLSTMKMAIGFAPAQGDQEPKTFEGERAAAQRGARLAGRSIPESVVRSIHREKVGIKPHGSPESRTSVRQHVPAPAATPKLQISGPRRFNQKPSASRPSGKSMAKSRSERSRRIR